MYLLLITHSSNPDYIGDCDCAAVELTPELLGEIRSRIALAHEARQRDANLCALHFWGSTVAYFDYALLNACQEAIAAVGGDQAAQQWLAGLETSGCVVLPEGIELGKFEAQRTECERMIVSVMTGDGGVAEISWEAIPKHSDVCIATRDMSLAVLQGLTAARSPASTKGRL